MVRGAELLGLRVSIRWTGDPGKPWYSGSIAEWRPYDEMHLIAYDDGDQKAHNLKESHTLTIRPTMYVLVAPHLLSAALRGSGLVARALLRADLFAILLLRAPKNTM